MPLGAWDRHAEGETHTCTADDGKTTNVKEKGTRGKSHELDDGKTTNAKEKGAREKSHEQSLVYAPGRATLLLRGESLANGTKQSWKQKLAHGHFPRTFPQLPRGKMAHDSI